LLFFAIATLLILIRRLRRPTSIDYDYTDVTAVTDSPDVTLALMSLLFDAATTCLPYCASPWRLMRRIRARAPRYAFMSRVGVYGFAFAAATRTAYAAYAVSAMTCYAVTIERATLCAERACAMARACSSIRAGRVQRGVARRAVMLRGAVGR